jgi:hypothetical protein
MSKRDPDWCYIPPAAVPILIVPCATVLAAVLLPVVARLRTAEIGTLYGVGVGAGLVGALLLLLVRLPLYREHRFWTEGLGQLDQKHRRICRLAYAVIMASLLLLVVVWLRTR